MMKNKEQLLYFFLQGKISLSQYDYKFMANLQTMIQRDHRVTSNQAALFDNLISKYKKQLSKNGYDKAILKELPWKVDVVESTPEYTGANLRMSGDELVLKVPFNKTFISAFREIKHNTYEWDKDNKVYRSPFSTTALKIGITAPKKHFHSTRVCDEIQSILDSLKPYDAIWNPTLVKMAGKLIVVAVNDRLGELINDIELTESPKTFHLLAKMGIAIHPDLLDTDEKKFAAEYITQVDIEMINEVPKWIKNLGCDYILLGRGMGRYGVDSNLKAELENACVKFNIQTMPTTADTTATECILIQHSSSIDSMFMHTSDKYEIGKCVIIRNSRPVEVK